MIQQGDVFKYVCASRRGEGEDAVGLLCPLSGTVETRLVAIEGGDKMGLPVKF